MDSFDLTEAQLDALFKRLGPMTHYLCKLKDKMHAQGWPEDDELFKLARAAHGAMHALTIPTHYLACGKVKRPFNAAVRDSDRLRLRPN